MEETIVKFMAGYILLTALVGFFITIVSSGDRDEEWVARIVGIIFGAVGLMAFVAYLTLRASYGGG